MVVVRAKRRCPAAMSALAEEGAGGGNGDRQRSNGECRGRRGDSGGEREDADAASEAGSEAAAAAAAAMREDSVEEQGGHADTPMLFLPRLLEMRRVPQMAILGGGCNHEQAIYNGFE